MISEIKWNPGSEPPKDSRRVLVVFGGWITVGHVVWCEGKPVFADDDRFAIHGVSAWSELPEAPPVDYGASESSDVSSIPETVSR
jgi:hypothetical protein